MGRLEYLDVVNINWINLSVQGLFDGIKIIINSKNNYKENGPRRG